MVLVKSLAVVALVALGSACSSTGQEVVAPRSPSPSPIASVSPVASVSPSIEVEFAVMCESDEFIALEQRVVDFWDSDPSPIDYEAHWAFADIMLDFGALSGRYGEVDLLEDYAALAEGLLESADLLENPSDAQDLIDAMETWNQSLRGWVKVNTKATGQYCPSLSTE